MSGLKRYALAGTAAMLLASTADAQTLRLLTWGGYAPQEVVDAFTAETGITVEVTLSNNEDMISRLRATGGAGFDLAQPSQDRILGPQEEFGIYRPIDLSRIDTTLFIPELLTATTEATMVEGEVFGVPHIWGVSGFAVDRSVAGDIRTYTDLCAPELAGRISMRTRRIALLGFAFAAGEDPFAAYDDPARYAEIMTAAAEAMTACRPNIRAFWTGQDDLLAMMRSGEVVAAEAWDSTGFLLHAEDPKWNFVAPATGALGWVDTFALPAEGEADDAAYAWINYVMRPEIAAQIVNAAGSFSASAGSDDLVDPALRAAYQDAFSSEVIANIRWFPPIPAGLEAIEGRLLDRIAAQ